ncbi:hypothetical protein, partial [Klebsiella pneumoniae]|uniref:hypothetical protein n=1 Tax=Klebsiella pneumoniae TaxID=573 RepID=UPI00272FC429
MNRKEKSLGDLLYALGERAKELNCLYHVEEVLAQQDVTFDEIFDGVLAAISPGLQFPDISRARIHFGGKSYSS